MFVPSKPCRTVHDFRGENLSVFNNILYWAHECVPYVVHLPASSFGIHVAHLLEALQVVNHVQAFASLLCEPGYLGATENIQYNFWLHYGWLCLPIKTKTACCLRSQLTLTTVTSSSGSGKLTCRVHPSHVLTSPVTF